MKKGNIIWFIEHISRELDVACAVSVLFKKKFGQKITILPFTSDLPPVYLKDFHPKIIILPYCYSVNDRMLKKILLKFPDVIYFNMAWEQIFYKANLEYKAPQDWFAKEQVLHHCWSRERSEFLQKRGIPRENIIINGHPAYKLYKKPYNKIFKNRLNLSKKFNLDPKKKWIFFPENYSWFFYSDHQFEEIIKNGQDRKTALIMRNYCGKAIFEVLKWLQTAGDKFNNVEIILRPRPAISAAYFTSVLEKLSPGITSKLNIIKDYSVREWILASNMVVSSFSTSLIEASIADRPTFMLEPFRLPNALIAPWYKYVIKIKTQSHFLNLCREIHLEEPKLLKSWAIRKFFVNSDPIISLMDCIRKIYLNDKPINRFQNRMKFKNISEPNTGWYWLIGFLGLIKRKILKQQAYYLNDDSKIYLRQINSRYTAFKEGLIGKSKSK